MPGFGSVSAKLEIEKPHSLALGAAWYLVIGVLNFASCPLPTSAHGVHRLLTNKNFGVSARTILHLDVSIEVVSVPCIS